MGSTLEPNVLGLELNEIPEQRVSTAKAKRVLRWRPQVPLEAGLRDTIDWYRTHLHLVT